MKRRYKPNVFRDIYEQPYSDAGVTRMKLYKSSKNSLGMVQRLDLLKRLPVHNGCVNSISWNETGDYILSGSDDQHIVISHGFSHKVLTKFKTSHRANIFSAKFLPGQGDRHIVSCSGDGIILFTDLNRPQCTSLNQFSCHLGTTYDVITVPNDSHSFLSCGEDGTVRWFDLRVKEKCRKSSCKDDILITCERAVTSLSLNPSAPYQLAVGCSDSRVRLFDRRMLGTVAAGYVETASTCRPLSTFTVPSLKERSCRITSLNYSPEGDEILVSFSSDLLYLFSIRDRPGNERNMEAAEDCDVDGGPSSDRSPAPVRRLRLRGDWSDTGPNARPERDGGSRGTGEFVQTRRTLHSSLMQRMTDVLSRMLNDPATRANLNGGRQVPRPPEDAPAAAESPPEVPGSAPRSPVFPFEHPLNESFSVNPFLPLDSPMSPDTETEEILVEDETLDPVSEDVLNIEPEVDSPMSIDRASDDLANVTNETRESLDPNIAQTPQNNETLDSSVMENLSPSAVQNDTESRTTCSACESQTLTTNVDSDGDLLVPTPPQEVVLDTPLNSSDVAPSTCHESKTNVDSSGVTVPLEDADQDRETEEDYSHSSAAALGNISIELVTESEEGCRPGPAAEGGGETTPNSPRFTLGDPVSKMQLVDPSLDENFRRDSPLSPPLVAMESVAIQATVEVAVDEGEEEGGQEAESDSDDSSVDVDTQQFPRVMYPRPRQVMIPPGDITQQRSNEDLIDTLHSMRHRNATEPAVLLSVSDVTESGASFAVRLATETNRGPPDIPFLPQNVRDRAILAARLRGEEVPNDIADEEEEDEEEDEEGSEDVASSSPGHRLIHPIEQEMDEVIEGTRRRRSGFAPCGGTSSFQPSVRQVFSGHRNARTMIKEACFWGTDYVMSGSDCGHVFVWERSTGQLVQLFEGDDHVVNCLQPHPTLPILATSGIDYDVKLWAPLATDTTFDTALADMLKKRNEIMLEETKDTITVPATFMIRMLACLNQIRRGGRRNRRTDDEPNE